MVSTFDGPMNFGPEWLFENGIGWLSTNQAAFYLGMTPNALRILVCRGKLKAHKLGRRLKFKLKDLKSLLSEKGV